MTTCPRAVIDGKRDCGAKGDDIADPTGKLQSGEQAVFTFENLTSPAIVEETAGNETRTLARTNLTHYHLPLFRASGGASSSVPAKGTQGSDTRRADK